MLISPRMALDARTSRSALRGTFLAFGAGIAILGGCGFTAQGDFVRTGVAEKGAQAADEGLRNATWFICQAATIGSIKRAYGTSVERAHAYNRFCPDSSAVNVLRPEGTPDLPTVLGPQ